MLDNISTRQITPLLPTEEYPWANPQSLPGHKVTSLGHQVHQAPEGARVLQGSGKW